MATYQEGGNLGTHLLRRGLEHGLPAPSSPTVLLAIDRTNRCIVYLGNPF
jgi:hypothetical protein